RESTRLQAPAYPPAGARSEVSPRDGTRDGRDLLNVAREPKAEPPRDDRSQRRGDQEQDGVQAGEEDDGVVDFAARGRVEQRIAVAAPHGDHDAAERFFAVIRQIDGEAVYRRSPVHAELREPRRALGEALPYERRAGMVVYRDVLRAPLVPFRDLGRSR